MLRNGPFIFYIKNIPIYMICEVESYYFLPVGIHSQSPFFHVYMNHSHTYRIENLNFFHNYCFLEIIYRISLSLANTDGKNPRQFVLTYNFQLFLFAFILLVV